MADTLTLRVELTYTPDTASSRVGVAVPAQTKTVTMTGTEVQSGMLVIGSTNELVAFNTADITTPGYLLLKNIDATTTVVFDAEDETVYTGKLLPGEFALLRLGHTEIYMKCTTAATTNVQFWVFEQ